jgi:hypothetical protein
VGSSGFGYMVASGTTGFNRLVNKNMILSNVNHFTNPEAYIFVIGELLVYAEEGRFTKKKQP